MSKKIYKESLQWVKENIVDFPQDEKEFLWFWQKVYNLQPKILVEIGSRNGASFYMLAHACPKDSLIISIDMPNGPWGKPNSVDKLNKVFDKLYSEGYKNARVIWGNSRDINTKSKLMTLIDHKFIDVLFIDGDHSYKGVKSDWEIYSPLVTNIIGFHDISKHKKKIKLEVWKLWQEIKKKNYKTEEFINDSKIGFGIGLIYF